MHDNLESVRNVLKSCIDTIKKTGVYNEPKKNFLNYMDQRALIALIGIAATAIFFLGKFYSGFSSYELRQTINNLQQENKNLTDTIIVLKLTKKDTIPSMQEPTK